MNLTQRQVELLSHLADVCADSGEPALSKRLLNLRASTLESLIAHLSREERREGLPIVVWELIVKYKGWVGGKVTDEAFIVSCRQAQGLM